MSESQEQVVVAAHFRWKYPRKIIYAIPNGAFLKGNKQQRERQMAKLKREGVCPGIPDLCIPVARGDFHGLYIEVKDVKKTKSSLSKSQKEHLDKLKIEGYRTVWCPGASAAIYEIDKYMRLKK